MPMVTVSISPQQAAGIRAAVDNGGYASSSEVVREALRLWDTARLFFFVRNMPQKDQ
ncbi:ribbon-helix-helix protein, CopG family [Rhizobium leguminosarum]|nr:ribbon-helix-helix protein, CopG family [Rhizobium leguminosarum]